MTILKCKMCGGDIEVRENQTFGTCDSCGSTMTLPNISDDKKANLFNRANHFRRLNDFDKAISSYELILNEDDSDAEAHWGVLLSRYGVEYVEDPKTHSRIPTLHRMHAEAITSDPDYLAAIKYAPDGHAKHLYEQEGKQIADIQKRILSISTKTEPYDVFICYKESSESGIRTKDSALAQDIYYQLENNRIKTFYAKITLEDKLGQEYEPYIFAALNSTKVMVVVTTSSENLNAVWVKNEWSRFLVLMRKDSNRLLIPCYQDMDAYDLPEELSLLQSQDMSKIGFITDLIRGIKKVINASVTQTNSSSIGTISKSSNAEPLLRRMFLFLEDGDFSNANEYADRVLDIEPENAKAYVGKLCAELQTKEEKDLDAIDVSLSEFNNYKRAIKFADSEYEKVLEGYNQANIARIEEARKSGIYSNALKMMEGAHDEQAYIAVAVEFDTIEEYKDSTALAEQCRKKSEESRAKNEELRLQKQRHDKKIGIAVVGFLAVVIITITVYIQVKPIINYNNAVTLYEDGEYQEAITAFLALGDYKDSKEKVAEAEEKARNTLETGDTYKFGVFKDNIIEWLVLAVEDNKALLITKDCIGLRKFNDTNVPITWEDCTLRYWLNHEFYDTFEGTQKKLIVESEIINKESEIVFHDNLFDEDIESISENNTQDKIFLLSVKEVNTYLKNSEKRIAYYEEDANWFLRDSVKNFSEDGNFVFLVSPNGDLTYASVAYVGGVVRPALWLNLE